MYIYPEKNTQKNTHTQMVGNEDVPARSFSP